MTGWEKPEPMTDPLTLNHYIHDAIWKTQRTGMDRSDVLEQFRHIAKPDQIRAVLHELVKLGAIEYEMVGAHVYYRVPERAMIKTEPVDNVLEIDF